MVKVSDTQAQFQAAANLYAKAMSLMKERAIGRTRRLEEMENGLFKFHGGRRLRHAGPDRPHEGHRGKYRQRQFHFADRRAAIPIAARLPPSPRISTDELGATLVDDRQARRRQERLQSQYDPGNPNADNQGYVKLPNVDPPDGNHGHARRAAFLRSRSHVMDTTKQMMARNGRFAEK